MINQIKTYLVLGVIVLIVGSATYYLKTHSIVKNSVISTYKGRITLDSLKINYIDSLAWSLQQELDINNENKASREMVVSALSAENKRLRKIENTCCEELKYAEESGGIIRDTIRLNIWGKIKRKK